MLGLRMIGNCEKCFHRSVCEHKKNFETIEQTDEKNCVFYMPIPLLSEDIVLKLLDFNSLYNSSVEVVRCKDCKHYVVQRLECRYPIHNGIIGIDGFCSYGERKDS